MAHPLVLVAHPLKLVAHYCVAACRLRTTGLMDNTRNIYSVPSWFHMQCPWINKKKLNHPIKNLNQKTLVRLMAGRLNLWRHSDTWQAGIRAMEHVTMARRVRCHLCYNTSIKRAGPLHRSPRCAMHTSLNLPPSRVRISIVHVLMSSYRHNAPRRAALCPSQLHSTDPVTSKLNMLMRHRRHKSIF